MVLPGEHAKRFRINTAQLLLKYFAGDERLVSEIRANAEFNGLFNEMAREELQAQDTATGASQVDTFEQDRKRRLENVEVMKVEDAATGASQVDTFKQDRKRRLENVEVMKVEDAATRRRLKVDLEVKLKTANTDLEVKLKTVDVDIQILISKSSSRPWTWIFK
jgi:hypothetical protein